MDEGVIAPPLLASLHFWHLIYFCILTSYINCAWREPTLLTLLLLLGPLPVVRMISSFVVYLTKIAATAKMQIIVSVTSEVQIESISNLGREV